MGELDYRLARRVNNVEAALGGRGGVEAAADSDTSLLSGLGAGGGSLPTEWEADEGGGLNIALTDEASGGIFITAPGDFADLLLRAKVGATTIFKLDPAGTIHSVHLASMSSNLAPVSIPEGFLAIAVPSNNLPALHIDSSLSADGQRAIDVVGINDGGMSIFADGSMQISPSGKENPCFTIHAPGEQNRDNGGINFIFNVESASTYLFTIEIEGGITVWDGGGGNKEGGATDNRTWWVTHDGYEAAQQRPAPNDADILPGQAFSYFDATDGSAHFVRRGRTLDGTLVQVSSAMAPA